MPSLTDCRKAAHRSVMAGNMKRAARHMRRTLKSHPSDPVTLTNLAMHYYNQGRDAEALDLIWEAAKSPGIEHSAQFQYVRGLICLKMGFWTQGWLGHEYRFAVGAVKPQAPYESLWHGGPCERLNLWNEQGHGDQIQMVRFVRQAKEQSGAFTTLVVDPTLVGLFEGVGADAVVSELTMQPGDQHAPLMSLPRILGVTKENVRGDAYLGGGHRVPQGDVGKVGLCWRGELSNAELRDRSIPEDLLGPIKAACDWTSLQYGAYGFEPKDWAETAEVAASCRLIVTIDTGMAHLAGALGIPTLLMLRYQGDWRWGQEIDCTPWYDSVKIFRQPKMGDWPAVIEAVAKELLNAS